MKQKWMLFIVVLLSLYSCAGNFSKGVKKDLSTGLSASYKGFSLEDVYMTDAKGNKMTSNEVALSTHFNIEASGVEHYTVDQGRVYPGCAIILTDKTGKEILNMADAFEEMKDGTTPDQANVLKATLNTGEPMVISETYHLSVRFYDKRNPENEIAATVDLKVIQ